MASADDAFGSSVGLESTGIYTEGDTRGFSPSKAGNARIDGLYYDPVGALSSRLRASNAIRVGFAAQEYPFNAPTGIVEYRFKSFANELGTSFGYNGMAYGGNILEWDLRVPIIKDKLSFVGGMASSDLRQSDGASNKAWGYTARFIARAGSFEVAPFVAKSWFRDNYTRPLVTVNSDYLPPLPKVRQYLGQEWARGRYRNYHIGITAKGSITDRLSMRAGLFRAVGDKQENYAEIFSLVAPSGLASHRLIADPEQDLRSTSGEAQLAYRFETGGWQHRLIAGFRGRNRITESGGSDVRSLGQVIYGQPNPIAQPTFSYATPNHGQVKQSSLLLGYLGKLGGTGSVNLGLQRARYRAVSREGRTGVLTRSRDDLWLYNAVLGIDLTPELSLYAGTEKGLEDSGVAPENALNRAEQLPATRTTQHEGGVRWKFHGGQLVASVFQISKPYFSFDQTGTFTQAGQVRHRGFETSLSGHFGKRLNVLAGAVLTQPRVSGAARDAGLVGERPAGAPSVFARLDANYRTDIFGGLTPTATLVYTGERAVGARPLASLGNRQLMVPGYFTVDLGLRQQFKIGSVPMSVRALVWNVFDAKSWRVVAANTLYMEERRRVNFTVAADF